MTLSTDESLSGKKLLLAILLLSNSGVYAMSDFEAWTKAASTLNVLYPGGRSGFDNFVTLTKTKIFWPSCMRGGLGYLWCRRSDGQFVKNRNDCYNITGNLMEGPSCTANCCYLPMQRSVLDAYPCTISGITYVWCLQSGSTSSSGFLGECSITGNLTAGYSCLSTGNCCVSRYVTDYDLAYYISYQMFYLSGLPFTSKRSLEESVKTSKRQTLLASTDFGTSAPYTTIQSNFMRDNAVPLDTQKWFVTNYRNQQGARCQLLNSLDGLKYPLSFYGGTSTTC